MRVLRLPAPACPSAHCFAFRVHRALRVRVRRSAPRDRQGCRGARSLWVSRRSNFPALSPMGASGISQVPRRPLLRLCDGPRPRTAPTGLALADGRMLPPGPTHRRRRHEHDFGATRAASSPAVYASRPPSPSAMQDSLPAGGLRLCRAGVEPAGSLRTVSVRVSPPFKSHPPFRGLPDASRAHS